MTSKQRPPVNNGHYFWVPRVVVVHRFECIYIVTLSIKKSCVSRILTFNFAKSQRKWKKYNSKSWQAKRSQVSLFSNSIRKKNWKKLNQNFSEKKFQSNSKSLVRLHPQRRDWKKCNSNNTWHILTLFGHFSDPLQCGSLLFNHCFLNTLGHSNNAWPSPLWHFTF
jgi:hypothetical protein